MALDEATKGFLAQLAAMGDRTITDMTVDEARGWSAVFRNFFGPGPAMSSVRDEVLTARDGSNFRVRVLVPPGDISALIVYCHGGGWVIGDIDENDFLCREIAVRLGAGVVNVEYRLAPEHRCPAAADDAWDALSWASQHLLEIAGRPVPVIVMGDSAGANLSAVVAQRARAQGGPRLDYQVLICPVTNANLDNDTYLDPENQLLLNRDAMIWYWDHYAPDPASRRNPDASPLQAYDLTGLAPAIVLTAEHDVLREEGEAYAERLREAGVPVRLRRFPGQMHGFFTMLNILPASTEAISYLAAELGPLLVAQQEPEGTGWAGPVQSGPAD